MVSGMSSVLLAETKLDIVLSLVATLAKETIPGADSVSVTLIEEGKTTTPSSSEATAPRIDQVRRFAEQATVLLANAQALARSEQRNEQLREALASRDIIGQAKGIVM